MIVQKKFCTEILHDPKLLGKLIENLAGSMTLQGIDIALKRESLPLRRTLAMYHTLKEKGYKDDEILESENNTQCVKG